jgi:1-acyl-sn-glycerol-3-phosphate acyltransferase
LSNLFYNLVWTLGYPAFWTSSRPIVLHRERAKRSGAYILAVNHFSPYDIPCLMATHPRVMDFVSITEVMRKPFVGWLFRNMGTFALDRNRADPQTVRVVLDRLARGRIVTMFPEGRIPTPEQSVLNGGRIRRGIGRIAQLADVPIVPCVILGTVAYRRFASWLPVRRTIYGVNFGKALMPTPDSQDPDGTMLETQLVDSLRSLDRELVAEATNLGVVERLARYSSSKPTSV